MEPVTLSILESESDIPEDAMILETKVACGPDNWFGCHYNKYFVREVSPEALTFQSMHNNIPAFIPKINRLLPAIVVYRVNERNGYKYRGVQQPNQNGKYLFLGLQRWRRCTHRSRKLFNKDQTDNPPYERSLESNRSRQVVRAICIKN